MKRVRIGALRHRVTLQSAVVSPGPGGGAQVTWQTVDELWASVAAVRGSETVLADGLQGTTLFDITVRYRDDIGSENRFMFDAATYDVRAALDPDGRKRWLVCRCERRSL